MNLNTREFKIILESIKHFDRNSELLSERQLMSLTGFSEGVVNKTLKSLEIKRFIKIKCSEVHVTDLGITNFLAKFKG